jgi:hypothetical protein
MSEWIPASQLPPMRIMPGYSYWLTSNKVLIVDKWKCYHIAVLEQGGIGAIPRWYCGEERWDLDEVLYWMPLPEVPNDLP